MGPQCEVRKDDPEKIDLKVSTPCSHAAHSVSYINRRRTKRTVIRRKVRGFRLNRDLELKLRLGATSNPSFDFMVALVMLRFDEAATRRGAARRWNSRD